MHGYKLKSCYSQQEISTKLLQKELFRMTVLFLVVACGCTQCPWVSSPLAQHAQIDFARLFLVSDENYHFDCIGMFFTCFFCSFVFRWTEPCEHNQELTIWPWRCAFRYEKSALPNLLHMKPEIAGAEDPFGAIWALWWRATSASITSCKHPGIEASINLSLHLPRILEFTQIWVEFTQNWLPRYRQISFKLSKNCMYVPKNR